MVIVMVEVMVIVALACRSRAAASCAPDDACMRSIERGKHRAMRQHPRHTRMQCACGKHEAELREPPCDESSNMAETRKKWWCDDTAAHSVTIELYKLLMMSTQYRRRHALVRMSGCTRGDVRKQHTRVPMYARAVPLRRIFPKTVNWIMTDYCDEAAKLRDRPPPRFYT